jgi:hypothetical protein
VLLQLAVTASQHVSLGSRLVLDGCPFSEVEPVKSGQRLLPPIRMALVMPTARRCLRN